MINAKLARQKSRGFHFKKAMYKQAKEDGMLSAMDEKLAQALINKENKAIINVMAHNLTVQETVNRLTKLGYKVSLIRQEDGSLVEKSGYKQAYTTARIMIEW